MAFDPITSCQIDGKKMETVTDFIFLGSKITVDGDCGHKIKRRLFLGRKAMTDLVAQWVKHLPATRETGVQSPGREVPLEKETASHSTTLAWKMPWTEEPGKLQSMGLQTVAQD